MSSFISEKFNVDLVKAKEIQKKYFYEYGTTLSGLMNHDNIDPQEFLEFVHDIDISWLPKDEVLREELIKIKEKKIIFTNGSHAHVENVTKQLGIDGLFDGAFDITDANYVPKPHLDPYQKLMKKFDFRLSILKKKFDFNDVVKTLIEKLIYRHPHVYGDTLVESIDEVKRNWEKLKIKNKKEGLLSGVPKNLPVLIKTNRVQEKVASIGFDFPNVQNVIEKIKEEFDEFNSALSYKDKLEAEEEFGDILFSLINYFH